MLDVLMIAATIAFFLLAGAYTLGCDRMDGNPASRSADEEAGNA